MTDTTTSTVCPNCQHPHHLPGTECATPVHHGPNRWHLCLCLARPGAALSCPPQMTCQGGTLGYADVWYLQHGHVLVGEDGTIAPGAVQPGVASVGFPSGPDIAAAVSAAVVPAADRAALPDCVCGEPGTPGTVHRTDGPCYIDDRAALRDRIAEALYTHDHPGWRVPMREADVEPVYRERAAAVLSVLPAPADRAAVLEEAAAAVAADTGFHIRYGAAIDYAEHYAALLRRMAVESAVVDRVAAETPPAETGCAHCGQSVRRITGTLTAWWVHDPGGNTVCHPQEAASSTRAEPGPAVEARPGKDTETPGAAT